MMVNRNLIFVHQIALDIFTGNIYYIDVLKGLLNTLLSEMNKYGRDYCRY